MCWCILRMEQGPDLGNRILELEIWWSKVSQGWFLPVIAELFRKLKTNLKRTLWTLPVRFFNEKSQNFYRNGIVALPIRWQQDIDQNGTYFFRYIFSFIINKWKNIPKKNILFYEQYENIYAPTLYVWCFLKFRRTTVLIFLSVQYFFVYSSVDIFKCNIFN